MLISPCDKFDYAHHPLAAITANERQPSHFEFIFLCKINPEIRRIYVITTPGLYPVIMKVTLSDLLIFMYTNTKAMNVLLSMNMIV